MTLWASLVNEAHELHLWLVLLVLLLSVVLVRVLAPQHRRRLWPPLVVFGIYLLVIPVSAHLRTVSSTALAETRLLGLTLGTLAGVWAILTLVFGAIDARLRQGIPRIVSDLLIATVSIAAVSAQASRHGVNLSSLLATSAVLTAVIGLSLQDTLGNMVAGVTLQMDSSIRIGDWIRIGDITGRVSEIRWRFTAIETRNWETVIIPNAQLIKGQVTVLGRRQGAPTQLRRWVYFNVDFRTPPTQVINCVEDALRAEPITGVADTPQPNCILIEVCDSYYRFAARYWLVDLANDDPTDSVVRTRVVNALRRINVSLSIPAKAIFVTTDTDERREQKTRRDVEERVAWLRRIALFDSLSVEEAGQLALALHLVPFARGEVLTRQGAEAHWLYIIVSGTVSVRVQREGVEREVARLSAGQFFGEMGLLTGEARTATVTALEDVHCYRLDKEEFHRLILGRPEMAEEMAAELARRRTELVAARDDLDAEARRDQEKQTANDLLCRMRSFFRLDRG